MKAWWWYFRYSATATTTNAVMNVQYDICVIIFQAIYGIFVLLSSFDLENSSLPIEHVVKWPNETGRKMRSSKYLIWSAVFYFLPWDTGIYCCINKSKRLHKTFVLHLKGIIVWYFLLSICLIDTEFWGTNNTPHSLSLTLFISPYSLCMLQIYFYLLSSNWINQ